VIKTSDGLVLVIKTSDGLALVIKTEDGLALVIKTDRNDEGDARTRRGRKGPPELSSL